MDEHKVVLSTISSFKQKILKEHYMESLSAAFLQVVGFPIEIEITSRDVSLEEQRRLKQAEQIAVEEEKERLEDERDKEIMTRNIEGKDPVVGYTFDNFIVGDSNRFAHAACWAVAQSFTDDEEILTDPLKDKYNPLFIYGPSGLGKTHLLYAITNEIKRRTPDVKIIYIRGEDFVNELVECMQKQMHSAFRAKYRGTDVLLIDDIHFIAGKTAMQEEFFNTFTSLYEAEKQIILTSDRPPCEIKNLTDRLRTRFEWGLTADIQPPSPELRAAIIKMKAQKYGIDLSDEIVYYMADKIKDNIRTIEGAIKKLNLMQMLTHTPVTLEVVKRALADVQSGTGESSFLIDKIFRAVSKYYDVPIDTLKSPRRQQNIVLARQVCMYLLRTLTDSPLSEIGSFFNRDHTTVINAVNKVENMMEEDARIKEDVDTLTEQVKK
jgi:chromosomal replication initiator protein